MAFRIIARLEIKSGSLVKGIQLEGLRKLGDPLPYMNRYYKEGIDEVFLQDVVASLYNHNNLTTVIAQANQNIFVPIAVGGGIKSLKDAIKVIRSGADKIVVNTGFINNPKLIEEIASSLGSQAICVAIEARGLNKNWECMIESGRTNTQVKVFEWVKEVEDRGAGEILLTSIDREGTLKGVDLNLIEKICKISSIPVIANGGTCSNTDVLRAAESGASGIAISAALHYKKINLIECKRFLNASGVAVRI